MNFNLYWRIRTFILLYTGFVLYTLCKKSLASLSPTLVSEKVLSAGQIGALASAFSMSFSVSKLLSGFATDKLAPPVVFGTGLVVCGLALFLAGLMGRRLSSAPATATPFWVWMMLWIGLGLFQGCCWAPCARLLTQRYDKQVRGRWWSSLASAKTVGAALAAPLFAGLAVSHSWYYALSVVGLTTGLMGLIVPLLLVKPGSESPAAAGATSKPTPFSPATFFGPLLEAARDSNVLTLATCACLTYFSFDALGSWFPLFLTSQKGIPASETQQFAARVSMVAELAGTAGCVVSGYLSDLLFAGYRAPVLRMFSLAAAASLASLLVLCPSATGSSADVRLPDTLVYQLTMGAWAFSVYSVMTLGGMAAVESASKRVAGSVTGVVGVMAYSGAALSGYPLHRFITLLDSWYAGFLPPLIVCHVAVALLSLNVHETKESQNDETKQSQNDETKESLKKNV